MTGAVTLAITVDVGNGTPPYEQLRARIAALVHAGDLVEGDRLPTVRGLAEQLGVAPGTVARAYAELETDELVEGRARADGLDDDTVLGVVHAALTDAR